MSTFLDEIELIDLSKSSIRSLNKLKNDIRSLFGFTESVFLSFQQYDKIVAFKYKRKYIAVSYITIDDYTMLPSLGTYSPLVKGLGGILAKTLLELSKDTYKEVIADCRKNNYESCKLLTNLGFVIMEERNNYLTYKYTNK